MLCGTCNQKIQEGTLVCPHCHAMDAVNRQQVITDKAQKQHRNTIMAVFKSKHFLMYMITLIVVALAHLSVILIEAKATISLMLLTKSVSVLGIIWLLIYTVFVFAPFRAMISSIRLYCNKDEHTFSSKTKGFSSLSRFWAKAFRIILGIIIFILFILLIAAVILLIYVNVIVNKPNESGSTFGGIGMGAGEAFLSLLAGDWITGILLFIVLPLIVESLLIVLCFKCADTYDKINHYVKQLVEVHKGNSGYFQQTLTVSSLHFYLLGAIFVLLGGVVMAFGNWLIEGLSAFGAFFISNGVYVIMNGIFFKHADEKLQASVLEYKIEKEQLEILQKRSFTQRAEYLRRKR